MRVPFALTDFKDSIVVVIKLKISSLKRISRAETPQAKVRMGLINKLEQDRCFNWQDNVLLKLGF